MKVPIFLDGNLTVDEIAAIFSAAGYMVTTEDGRLVARRVPAFLRRDETNVVQMPRVKRGRG